MKGYALAHLRNTPTTHPDVFEYMEKIQSTLEPFSGRFIIHGEPRTWWRGIGTAS